MSSSTGQDRSTVVEYIEHQMGRRQPIVVFETRIRKNANQRSLFFSSFKSSHLRLKVGLRLKKKTVGLPTSVDPSIARKRANR